jgi:hypothetical protein
MKCVNLSHPDFKSLLKESGISKQLLEVEVFHWMKTNPDEDRFPLLDELQIVKPEIQKLFELNPELTNIGTQKQYSQYLYTIFPDSKVKDIVYHGSIYDNKQKFKESTRVSGNYFAVNPNEALQHAQRQLQNKEDAVLYSILLNIKNPKIITKPIDYEDLDTEVKIYKGDTVFGTDYDAIIAEKVEEYNATKSAETVWLEKQIVIFEPEQAHILGSKQDIEGFKDFVNNNQQSNNTILYQTKTANQVRLEILKKVKADSKGFVNPHNYAKLLDLVAEYNKTQPNKKLSIGKTVTNKYYLLIPNTTMAQQSSTMEEANMELEEKLRSWAKENGISVEALDDAIARFSDRYQTGILGVADFANMLIGLAEGRAIDTLPEEVAHFAIRILKDKGDISVLRALEAVVLTDEYAEVKEEYKDVYTTEDQFREEALGKILAKEIVGQYKNSEIKGFSLFLKAIKDKFIKWVKGLFTPGSKAVTDIQNVITPLAKSILEGKNFEAAEQLADDMFFQLEQETEEEEEPEEVNVLFEQKKQFLEEAKLQLIERVRSLTNAAKSPAVIEKLKKEIDLLENQITLGELDVAIDSFINLAQSELFQIFDILEKGIVAKSINTQTLTTSEKFVDMYANLFHTFLTKLNEWDIPSEQREELTQSIQKASGIISILQPKIDALAKIEGIKVIKKGNTDAYGEKIDKDFDEQKMYEETVDDVSAYRLQIGNFKNANSKLLRTTLKIIFNAVASVKRFATQTGNDLLKAQDRMLKAGGKIDDLIEYDEKGNKTHYFIREYQWSKYYKELNKTKEAIAEALGFDEYNAIKKDFLDEKSLKVYKALWKQFFDTHTVKKKVTTEDIKGMVATVEITVPNSSYNNPRFEEVMRNEATKAYYTLLINTRIQAVKKLPIKYQTDRIMYMITPIQKSVLDRLTNTQEPFQKRIGKLVRDSMFLDPDDTQFGQVSVLNNKMVPIFFTKTLDNIDALSYDVAKTTTLFAEMAENFLEKNKISGDLGAVQLALSKRNYIKGKQRKTGIEGANEYKALELLLDTLVFGIERKEVSSQPLPSNKTTEFLGIAGKKFSWTKANQKFTTFIRDNNLALNITTALSGFLKGSGDSIIEDQIGIYTTNESKNWARGEFASNIGHVSSEIGRTVQTNKMHLIFQQNQIVQLDKVLHDSTRNRATRKFINKDIIYAPFETGDYGLKGRITLAIYDNYRLYNNQFITRARFQEKKAKEKGVVNDKAFRKQVAKEWSDLRSKSLYNAYEVVDGKLQVKSEFESHVTDAVLNTVQGKINHVTHEIDGTLSDTDKGALARTMLGDYLLMHRGWFIGMIDSRFKSEGTNPITEEEEIGTYRASADFLWNGLGRAIFKDKIGLQAAFATWHTLSPARKRGVAKTMLDLLYLNIVAMVAAMANIAADDDDDDDWTTQYTAYQLNRLLLEQGAAWSPAELAQMIDEPVVGARMIKDLLDISESWNFSETYQGGMYEGSTHAAKWWFKKVPIRNLYEMQFPQDKNNFIKQMVDSKYYQFMSPEQKYHIGLLGTVRNWLIPSDLASDYSDVVPELVDELQQDTSVYNGFN